MNKTWLFYDAVSGVFRPGSMSLPDEQTVADNTPPGHVATDMDADPWTQRMDVATGLLVPYQRPAVLQVLDAPTARAKRDELLAACDWVVTRAYERGQPVPADWATYRQALRDWPSQPGWPDAPLPSPPPAP
ncbi:hypothetical protein DBR42_29465 [Pelomonas sp. HMWF004]|nr:hypothetical protein DBR42_29465 [Pelomonas sp. HMWF004]